MFTSDFACSASLLCTYRNSGFQRELRIRCVCREKSRPISVSLLFLLFIFSNFYEFFIAWMSLVPNITISFTIPCVTSSFEPKVVSELSRINDEVIRCLWLQRFPIAKPIPDKQPWLDVLMKYKTRRKRNSSSLKPFVCYKYLSLNHSKK